MKKFVFAMALIASTSSAMAFNSNVGYPVDASRMSLSGSVGAVIDCGSREVSYQSVSNPIFKRHINKNIHRICYGDKEIHNVRFEFNRGGIETNMLARQPNRFFIR
nr:unknown function [Klebsiella phage vB_Kpn_K62PH164C2]